jgi:DNA-binding transcriptional regulator YiaG
MATLENVNLRSPAGLRAWRMARGLSQAELGRLLEVRYQTVYRWEVGAVPIPRTVELALRYLEEHP